MQQIFIWDINNPIPKGLLQYGRLALNGEGTVPFNPEDVQFVRIAVNYERKKQKTSFARLYFDVFWTSGGT